MDDFIYGEPQAIPPAQPPAEPPAADIQGPQVEVKGVKKHVDLKQLIRGLELTLTADEPASYEVTLLGSARSVEIRKNDVILAKRTLALAAGARELKLRPVRKLLKETPNRFNVRLLIEAADGAGNSASVRESIKVNGMISDRQAAAPDSHPARRNRSPLLGDHPPSASATRSRPR